MDITNLPNDIFLLILSYISPKDCIRLRRTSKGWQKALSDPDTCRHILYGHHPRAREVVRRHLSSSTTTTDWSFLLAEVSARYHHLKTGQPAHIEKLLLAKSFVVPEWCRHIGVATWDRHLQFEEKIAPFHYPDPLWSFDDGLIVFPSAERKQYVLYDIENETLYPVPFHPEGKIVRRLRLAAHVLIIEWCEAEPYHRLNETEEVHRHFATAWDVAFDERSKQWEVRFRNEWKTHFLGLPLNSRDRYFSTHNAIHYAMYFWQPNRSAWGEDDPIEALVVLDISRPSEYRPSEDSTGRFKPVGTGEGPQVVKRLSFADLEFYDIRQRAAPTLRDLALDERNVYVVEEDHRWLVGQHAGLSLPRLHKVRSTGIPFNDGPRWEDSCGAGGDVNLSFCERGADMRHPQIAPCWRHEEFPYLTITEAVDTEAGVRYCARHCFMLETLSISVKPRVHMIGPGYEISLKDDLWQQLLGKGKICGDERWLIGENAHEEIVILHFGRKGQNKRATGS